MLPEYFLGWSLKNLNYKKFNKNRKLHILTKKKQNTHTYIQIHKV